MYVLWEAVKALALGGCQLLSLAGQRLVASLLLKEAPMRPQLRGCLILRRSESGL